MSKARIYTRNLAANWIGYGANLVVMFFLSPFVVHSLGSTTYGVWSLVMSLTGYLGLAELGTRAGLGRFINYYLGRDEIDKVNAVISTALGFFLVCGVLLFAAAGVLGLLFDSIFTKVPAELIGSARLAIMLIALNLWLSLLGAAFSQILTAHERFDIFNGINLIVLAVRAAGTVIVLKSGGGIVELAGVQVASSIIGVLAAYAAAYRIFPRLHLRPSLVSRVRFRELFGFSIWAFVGGVAMNLLYWTDIVVIAILLGPEQVTFYAIAGMLIIYGRGLVTQVARVFSPEIIQNCGREDLQALRVLFRRGSTLIMAVGIPLLVGLIVFGKEFIILWMGVQYRVSYPVLVILSLSQFPVLAFMIAGPIYAGLGRVKLGAALTLTQGVINLGLTLVFVILLNMGIEGVAWGTFYPRVIFGVLAGVIAMRWIGLDVRRFVATIVSRWVILIVIFSGVCAGIAATPWRGRWDYFFLKVFVAILAYLPLAWVMLLSKDDRERIRGFLRRPVLARFRLGTSSTVPGSDEKHRD